MNDSLEPTSEIEQSNQLQPELIDILVAKYLKARGFDKTIKQLEKEKEFTFQQYKSSRLNEQEKLLNQNLNTLCDYREDMLHRIYNYTHSDNNPLWYEECYRYLHLWIHGCLDQYRYELKQIIYPIFINIIIDLFIKHLYKEAQDFFFKYQNEHCQVHFHDIKTLTYFMNKQRTLVNEQMKKKYTNVEEKKENNNKIEIDGKIDKAKFEELEKKSFFNELKHHELYKRYRQNKYEICISQVSHNLFMSWLNSSKLNVLLKLVNQNIQFRFISNDPQMSKNVVNNSNYFMKQTYDYNRQKVLWGMPKFIHEMEKKAENERDNSNIQRSNNERIEARTEFCDIPVSFSKLDKEEKAKIYTEIKNRIYCGPNKLPSICSYRFLNSQNTISTCCVSNDGRWIIAGGNDSIIRVFDVSSATGKSLYFEKKESKNESEMEMDDIPIQNESKNYTKLIGHKASVLGLSFHHSKEFFLSSSADSTVRLWSLEKKKCLSYYRGHCFPIWDVQFGPLGLYFATASHDRTARLWNTEKAVPLRIFAGHISDVSVVRFHPNCNYVATGSYDKTIRFWDIQKGKCVRLFLNHNKKINDLNFTSDGQCIVSVGDDGLINIYDIGTGRLLKSLVTKNSVKKVITSYSVIDSKIIHNEYTNLSSFPLIITYSIDKTIKFWDVNNQQKPLVKSIATNNLTIQHLEMTRSNLIMTSGIDCTE